MGIASLIVQVFMPIWQANAQVGDVRGDASGFTEICYALVEASETAPGDDTPLDQTKGHGHCLLCQFPSFGNVLLDTVYLAPELVLFDTVQYFPSDQQALSCAGSNNRPPARAPPA